MCYNLISGTFPIFAQHAWPWARAEFQKIVKILTFSDSFKSGYVSEISMIVLVIFSDI